MGDIHIVEEYAGKAHLIEDIGYNRIYDSVLTTSKVQETNTSEDWLAVQKNPKVFISWNLGVEEEFMLS